MGGLLVRPTGTRFFHTSSPQESLQKLMQDIKLLSHQLDDKIYDLANESAPAVLARLSIRSHSGSARLTRFGRCAAQSESSAFQIQRDGDRSGTCAKLDALSAAANARARARSPVPTPNAPPKSLPFPTAFPPSPAVFPPAPAACTPGSFMPFPGNFRFIPGPSASRADAPQARQHARICTQRGLRDRSPTQRSDGPPGRRSDNTRAPTSPPTHPLIPTTARLRRPLRPP